MSTKIQRPRRISEQNVPEESQTAVRTIGSSVNVFMEEVYLAVMGNLGPDSNLNMEFKTININVDSNGIPNDVVSFKSNIKGKIQGIQTIRAYDAVPTGCPFISFYESGGIVTLSHVTGLTADTDYQLVILTIGR